MTSSIESLIHNKTPAELIKCLFEKAPWVCFFDGEFSKDDLNRRSLILWDPEKIVVPENFSSIYPSWGGEIIFTKEPLKHIKGSSEAESYNPISGWYGFMGFEFGAQNLMPDELIKKEEEGTQFWWAYYQKALVYNHDKKEWFFENIGRDDLELFQEILQEEDLNDPSTGAFVEATQERNAHQLAIENIKKDIQKGEVYQVNLTTQFIGHTESSAVSIYLSLREKSPVPYGALLDCGIKVLSLSPELLLKCEEGNIFSSPIKGTAPRGNASEEDEKLKKELFSSAKNRAELVMIVDLVRNDMGRVCVPGSISVDPVIEVNSYSTVHHLESTVKGKLEEDKGAVDAFEALFPGGSITGAPKIASIKKIFKYEKNCRNVYTGSIGYFLNNGDCLLNIAIRTFTLENKLLRAYSGGGIVIDSSPEEEYKELLDKIRYILKI